MSEKKSTFSVTCSLLSRFLKERRNLGELGVLDAASRPQEPAKGLFRPATTLSSLPGVDVSAEDKTDRTATRSVDPFPQPTGFGCADNKNVTTKELEKPQFTIFYDGKMFVFDNFSSEKADELMKFAAKWSSGVADQLPASCPPTLAPAQPVPSELSMLIARRASLHRFFSKRKDRIISKAPYQVNCNSLPVDASSSKPEQARPWLGLGPEVSNPSSGS